jgi:periplasmic divalent cation tolerance protein
MDNDGAIIALITASDAAEAQLLTNALLESRLAACVNTISGISSRYWWRDKLEDSSETLLMVKSRAGLLKAIVKRVKELHSYEVPEVIALPVTGGNEDYLDWLRQETKRKAD